MLGGENVKKSIVNKCLSFIVSLILVINGALCSYAEDSAFAYEPALIPMFALVSSVCVATGMIASNATDAANELVNSVISEIKYSEVLKATSDDTYNSPYRVINSNGQPEKPNNNNKNGKWFALGAASALGGAVVGEKGMIQDIINTVAEKGGYSPMQGSIGMVSADKFKLQSSASNVALQLANYSNSCVTQFDSFLHCSWWDNKEFTPNDCWFVLWLYVPDLFESNPKYPAMTIQIMEKNDDLSFIELTNAFNYYTYTSQYGSLSYYYGTTYGSAMKFYNNDQVALKINRYTVSLNKRDANSELTWSGGGRPVSDSDKYFCPTNTSSYQQLQAYAGYKWQTTPQWQYTNNVYNVHNTFEQNCPDWDSVQLEILGNQLEMLNLGIQSLNNPWNAEQPQVQSGLSPADVISQILNNYLNPEYAPDPNPDPDPDPDPEPEPEPNPDPAPEPVPDSGYLEEFLLPSSITEKFPFCVPFDIVRCLRLFNTNSREAPVWTYDLTYGNNVSHIVLDLSIFDDVASFIRPIEYIGFLVGLAYATRYLIKG